MSKVSKRKHEMDSRSWASLPWAKVNINLDGETDDGIERKPHHQDEDFLHASNHYDDPDADPNDLFNPNDTKISSTRPDKKAKRFNKKKDTDRDTEGADDPGIILGLEVIDGSQYRVEKIPDKVGGYVSRLMWNNSIYDNHEKNKETKTNATERTLYPVTSQHRAPKEEVIAEKSKTDKRKSKLKGGDNVERNVNSKKHVSRKDVDRVDNINPGQRQLPVQDVNPELGNKSEITAKEQVSDNAPTQDNIDEIQMSWAAATGGVYLHNHICNSLTRLGFSYPTPIQASTLSASILGRRDIAGAAPTGSGKTLAYLIPILQFFLEERDLLETDLKNPNIVLPLTALILCPTRELALQVSQEFEKLSRKVVSCGVLVGGMSEEKQKRIIDVKRPPLLVATPGRLWSLMSSKDHKHLNDLARLRFLVVDEVDRMISKGSFPQLVDIFDAINKANCVSCDGDNMLAKSPKIERDDDDRLKSLEGILGEAKVVMLTDEILRKIEVQKQGSTQNLGNEYEGCESYSDQSSLNVKAFPDSHQEEDQSDTSDGTYEVLHRQTFVFSATLSLPPSSHKVSKKKKVEANLKNKGTDTFMAIQTIHDILKTAGARGQLKFVDLSHDLDPAKASCEKSYPISTSKPSSVQLPPGLSLYEILCTKKHKDSHMYAFLTTTEQGSRGPCLIFCNSIAAVKRVGQLLRVLSLPVRTLHGQMEQKARLSVIDTLKGKESRLIVVATDVAARGIDLPSIATVIQYDVSRSVNTFIHRSGRTARGLGSAAVGISVSLVDPSEEKEHKKICEILRGQGKRHFENASLDSHLLASAQTRVALATKIVECEQIQSKSTKNNNWMRQTAEDADLDVDEDLLDDNLANGSLRDQQRLKEAAKAKVELNKLLVVPMKKQRFGKFLSGAGLQKSMAAAESYVVQDAASAGRKTKRTRKRS